MISPKHYLWFVFAGAALGAFAVAYFALPYRAAPAQEPAPAAPQWDPAVVVWSMATATAPWAPRDSAASFVFQNKLWTMGGLNGNQEVNTATHYVEYLS